jgi:hypothetical protein
VTELKTHESANGINLSAVPPDGPQSGPAGPQSGPAGPFGGPAGPSGPTGSTGFPPEADTTTQV